MAQKKQPSISVIIPVYNTGAFLTAAVQSVLDQTLIPTQVLIIDDGSTQDHRGYFSSLSNAHQVPLRYIRTTHRGLSAARNEGLRHSLTEYVAFLDADDVWSADKLHKQMQVFEQSRLPRLGLVYCDYAFIDAHGAMIQTPGQVGENAHRYALDPAIRGDIFSRQISYNRVAGSASAVLIKRACFTELGMFDESLGAYEDMDMWLRISEQFSCDYAGETLVYLRRHQTNMTRNNQYATLHEKLKLYYKWKQSPAVTAPVLAYWYNLLITEWLFCLLNRQTRGLITWHDIRRTIGVARCHPALFLRLTLRGGSRSLRGKLYSLWQKK